MSYRLEEQEKLVTAEGLYRRALSLDDANPEAKDALRNINDTIQVSAAQKPPPVTTQENPAELITILASHPNKHV